MVVFVPVLDRLVPDTPDTYDCQFLAVPDTHSSFEWPVPTSSRYSQFLRVPSSLETQLNPSSSAYFLLVPVNALALSETTKEVNVRTFLWLAVNGDQSY